MKNKIKYSLFFLLIINSIEISAQVNTLGLPNNTLGGQNTFMEASGFEGALSNIGKGINFPRTNLTTFTFITNLIDSADVLNSFDGLIVFNSVTGVTVAGQGVITEVVPGFYFFSNPGNPENITGGQWKLIGDLIKNISPTTELTTSISVEGAKVYATKGTFVANGTSAIVTIVPPTGITGIYRIAIYKTEVSTDPATAGNSISRKLSSEVFEFNLNLSTNNVVTGYSPFTVVYPAGTYNYTLEYFK